MNASDMQSLEERLRQAARDFSYPAAPPIAERVMQRIGPRRAHRRLVWAALTIIVLLSGLLLVPPARAAVLELIQIGVVRIVRGPSLPPAPITTPRFPTPAVRPPLTATPAASLSALPALAGETTLPDARSQLRFPILLPKYPSDLGLPDKVYLQDMGGSVLLLVWLDGHQTGRVRMSLQEIEPGSWTITK